MTRYLLPTLAFAALALPASALADDTPYPSGDRPHAGVSLHELSGSPVAVTRFHTSARRRGGRLLVHVSLRAHLRSGSQRTAVLRAGACRPGTSSFLTCPPSFNRRVRIRRDGTSRGFNAFIRIPRRSVDTIRVSLTRPGDVVRPYHPQAYAMVELGGEGWRGDLAGRPFGAEIEPVEGVDVFDLRIDAAGVSDESVRPVLRWTGRSTRPVVVHTECTGSAGCASQTRDVAVTPERNGSYWRRPFLRDAAPTLGLTGTIGGAALFRAEVPRPIS
jgi:hypothetical protein